MKKFVLFRTGKIDVIGPFNSIGEAAEYIGERGLLGYQVLPLKDPNPEEDQPFPLNQQTPDYFDAWAEGYPWDGRRNHDIIFGEFMANAEKKFPDLFSLTQDEAGEWYMPKKILMIRGLRAWSYINGLRLGLKEAKDAVDDYEAVQRESK